MSFRYDLPQYGSRRKLISPAGTYDEYGEVIVEDDGSYYYSPHESEGEVGERGFFYYFFFLYIYCKSQYDDSCSSYSALCIHNKKKCLDYNRFSGRLKG